MDTNVQTMNTEIDNIVGSFSNDDIESLMNLTLIATKFYRRQNFFQLHFLLQMDVKKVHSSLSLNGRTELTKNRMMGIKLANASNLVQ